jgi:hypothetical protein
MTQSLPAAAAHESAWRRLLGVGRQPAPPEPFSFADVVWSHHEWTEDRDGGERGTAAESRYRRRRTAFEAANGPIHDAYWCRNEASAVALTIRPPKAWERVFGVQPNCRLHRVTDWVTGETPKVADLLHRCDTLAIRINEVLRGTSERIAIQWVYSVESHLLGFVERTLVDESHAREPHVAQEEAKELDRIERYYHRAGRQAVRIVYFWGMMIGLAVLAGLAAVVGTGLWAAGADLRDPDLVNLLASFSAGAIGAVVSVLSRMSSTEGARFSVDYEVGRSTIRRLASFRPVLGAVFGVAGYFALLGGQATISDPQAEPSSTSFYYFAIIAFGAGFTERWAKIAFGPADGTDEKHRPPGS